MLNVFFLIYSFNYILDDFIKQFVDFIFILQYLLYRFYYNFFLLIIRYFFLYIFSLLVKFLNLKGFAHIEFIFKKLIYIFYYCFIKINRYFIRYKKRTKMYYRFGFIKPFRFLFCIYFLILLIYIWKRRTMYKKYYYIYYYLLFYYLALFCSLFLYSLCSVYYLSIFFGITFTFFLILLCLK